MAAPPSRTSADEAINQFWRRVICGVLSRPAGAANAAQAMAKIIARQSGNDLDDILIGFSALCRFFFRNIKVDQFAAKSPRPISAVSDTYAHPQTARDFRRNAQAEPQHQADKKAHDGDDEVG